MLFITMYKYKYYEALFYVISIGLHYQGLKIMKIISLKLGVLLLLIVCSCKNENKSINSVSVIDIGSSVNNWKVANLSSFADRIQYVPLENADNMLLRNIVDADFSKRLILLADNNKCLLYDPQGNFISKIGNQGRGPGEYLLITDFGIGSGITPNIYVSSFNDIYEYNINGSFIKKYSNSLLINDTVAVSSWKIFSDSLFFGHIPNNTGENSAKAIIFDKYGKVVHAYKNYDLFTRDFKNSTSTYENFAHINYFKDTLFYKNIFNDTIWILNNQSRLVGRYTFNFGNYKFPTSERAKIQNWKLTMSNYMFVSEVFQTENYLFINCDFKSYFPAKRLTPKIIMGMSAEYNTTNALGIYNKTTKELFFCEPTSTDNPMFTSGIYNDIDAGPRFFPKVQVNDSTMVMFVSAKELKDHVESDDFKNNTPKYSERKKELKEIADNLGEFDNPILMFVTFKY